MKCVAHCTIQAIYKVSEMLASQKLETLTYTFVVSGRGKVVSGISNCIIMVKPTSPVAPKEEGRRGQNKKCFGHRVW